MPAMQCIASTRYLEALFEETEGDFEPYIWALKPAEKKGDEKR